MKQNAREENEAQKQVGAWVGGGLLLQIFKRWQLTSRILVILQALLNPWIQ